MSLSTLFLTGPPTPTLDVFYPRRFHIFFTKLLRRTRFPILHLPFTCPHEGIFPFAHHAQPRPWMYVYTSRSRHEPATLFPFIPPSLLPRESRQPIICLLVAIITVHNRKEQTRQPLLTRIRNSINLSSLPSHPTTPPLLLLKQQTIHSSREYTISLLPYLKSRMPAVA